MARLAQLLGDSQRLLAERGNSVDALKEREKKLEIQLRQSEHLRAHHEDMSSSAHRDMTELENEIKALREAACTANANLSRSESALEALQSRFDALESHAKESDAIVMTLRSDLSSSHRDKEIVCKDLYYAEERYKTSNDHLLTSQERVTKLEHENNVLRDTLVEAKEQSRYHALEAEGKVRELEECLASVRVTLAEQSAKNDGKDAKLDQLVSSLTNREKTLTDMERDVGAMRERITQLQVELANAENVRLCLEKESISTQNKVFTLEAELSTAVEGLTKATVQVDSLKSILKSHENVHDQYDALSSTVKTLTAENTVLREENGLIKQNITHLESKVGETEKYRSLSDDSLEAAHVKIDHLEGTVIGLHENISSLNTTISEMTLTHADKSEEFQKSLIEATKELSCVKQEATAHASEIERLRSSLHRSEKTEEKLKSDLQEVRQKYGQLEDLTTSQAAAINELEYVIKSLEEERDTLKARAEHAPSQWGGEQQVSKTELTMANADVVRLTAELDGMSSKVESTTEQLKETEKTLVEMREKLVESRTREKILSEEKEKIVSDLSNLQCRMVTISGIELEVTHLKESMRKVTTEYDTARQRSLTLQTNNEELSNEIKLLWEELNVSQQSRLATDDVLLNAHKKITALELLLSACTCASNRCGEVKMVEESQLTSAKTEFCAQIEVLSRQQEDNEHTILRLKEELAQGRHEVELMMKDKSFTENLLQRSEKACSQLTIELSGVKDKSLAVESDLKLSQLKLSKVTEENQALKAEVIKENEKCRRLHEEVSIHERKLAIVETRLTETTKANDSMAQQIKRAHTELFDAKLNIQMTENKISRSREGQKEVETKLGDDVVSKLEMEIETLKKDLKEACADRDGAKASFDAVVGHLDEAESLNSELKRELQSLGISRPVKVDTSTEELVQARKAIVEMEITIENLRLSGEEEHMKSAAVMEVCANCRN